MADEFQHELRSASLVDAEVKGRTVHGYAAVFDAPWNDRLIEEMGYVEEVSRGAFRKALSRSPNVPLLWQHETRDMLGTTGAGTLRLKEDAKGLPFSADLPENPLGDYVLSMIERGDVKGMSYGIATTPADSSLERRDGRYVRRINNVQRILDVSLTYEPSYEAATVELRSMGFRALPLQEIIAGVEAQSDESGNGGTSLTAVEAFGRVTEARISILEKGGIL